jgi:hypothetical protein
MLRINRPRRKMQVVARSSQVDADTSDARSECDDQMLVARKAAIEKGHYLTHVIFCCKAPNIDSGEIADTLLQLFCRRGARQVDW